MDILEFQPKTSEILCSEDEELPELCTHVEKCYTSVTGLSEVDKIETKRVKNCHRERCRVQKLNSSLHHLNMLLPQTQRSPGNGKHFSKAIILETCSDFIYQLENHVFDLFFDINDTKDAEDKSQHSSSYLSSLLSSRRAKHRQEEHKDSQRIKRPKNSFILFSMGQRKQLLKENPCLDNNKVSKILGEKWKNLDAKSKSNFNELAKIEKNNHRMKFPHFNYTIKRKRPRPITKKAVDIAVSDYLERDGSFSKLKRLIHKFPLHSLSEIFYYPLVAMDLLNQGGLIFLILLR
ncbi:high mobility group (HMG)-box containing transcription factor [Oopsacas minuta]|uniref:Sex-determining region Y protein n=1 Tax=Oopsacas minuta TaxID=111878 RepID=A0AAV7JZ12_9METZ|nr:high mobility group (HMG)-box containing transcription factor [Oopsacas minuta]